MNPIRIGVVGAGNRSVPRKPETSNWLGWTGQIALSPEFSLAAAQDVEPAALERVRARELLPAGQTFLDLKAMLDQELCEAILVTTPAEHHARVIRDALDRGLHVLVEKPIATSVAEAEELCTLAREMGCVLAVVHNWRAKDVGQELRRQIAAGRLGRVGHVVYRYIRDRENPALPPYIFKEPYPLLYAMGIHHLDLVRYVLKDEYTTISGHAFRPPWSLYESPTGLSLYLETRGGVSVMYSGTLSSKNRILPQESLLIEGEAGSLFTESPWLEPPLWFLPRESADRETLLACPGAPDVRGQYDRADARILEDFGRAIRKGTRPMCPGEDALESLKAVEAARRACEAAH